jgi:hypothetical protein
MDQKEKGNEKRKAFEEVLCSLMTTLALYVFEYSASIRQSSPKSLIATVWKPKEFWAAANRVRPLCSRREIARKAVTHFQISGVFSGVTAQTILEHSGGSSVYCITMPWDVRNVLLPG